MEAFRVVRGDGSLPLVANIPHSSTLIPREVRQDLLLPGASLEGELLRLTDRYTDELFAATHEVGGTAVIYNYSRLVVDPERFEKDEDEPMSRVGQGVIYLRDSYGRPLRHAPTVEEREGLLRRFYGPYHERLGHEVERCLAYFGRCLILDGHSFSSVPLPLEPDQDPNRPDICLGTDIVHTPAHLVEALEAFWHGHGLATRRDRPFAGTYVPLRHSGNPDVWSVMIEVNRRLYMNESTGEKLPSGQGAHRRRRQVAWQAARFWGKYVAQL